MTPIKGVMNEIVIKTLSSGFLLAQGTGPCNWAQWRADEELTDDDFFPEAGDGFRRELRALLGAPKARP